MSLNLRNRSLLTVQDFNQREFRYLLELARDLKRAKYARTEQKHLEGKAPKKLVVVPGRLVNIVA